MKEHISVETILFTILILKAQKLIKELYKLAKMEFVKTLRQLIILSGFLLALTTASSNKALDMRYVGDLATKGELQSLFPIIDNGYDLNEADEDGQTLLFWILGSLPLQNPETVEKTTSFIKEIVQRDVDINHVDDYGNTVLHMAAIHGTPELMEIFLQKGVKVNKQEITGNTALHILQPVRGIGKAKGKDSILDKVAVLMKYGANPDIKNNEGKLPKEVLKAELQADISSSDLQIMEIWDRIVHEEIEKRMKNQKSNHEEF